MNYRLIEFTLGEGQKPRWRVAPIDGGLPHGVPSIGWATEKMARRWVEKNKDRIVEVKRLSKKAKDSAEDSTLVSRIAEKYAIDVYSPILGKEFSGKGKDFDKALREKRYEGLYKQIDFYLKHYSKQHKLSDVQMKDLKRLVNEIRSYGKNGERWVTEVKKTVKEFKDSDDFAQDKLLFTSNGFANENGLLKKDPRKGLKTFEVTFVVKGKDGRPFKTGRSKMAASIEEAKRWAQSESKKYNGVTKIEVKEFKDSADEFENDVMTYPVKSNRNGSKYGFIEKICKTKAEAEALVESLKKKGLVASYKGVIYRDSSDTMERIKAKYCLDATKDQQNKKRYEVHYQATAPDGRIYLFVKEAVCTPGQLRGIMKNVEEEQKKKGVTLKKMFTKTVY